MASVGKRKNPGGSFKTLGLHTPLLKGVLQMNYRTPTPVQRKSLPVSLAGEDVVCMARTGSGKTAAFLIPVLQRLKEHSQTTGARAVILSPTRELAAQTEKFSRQMAKHTNLRMALLTGGDAMEAQFEALSGSPDLIVATPGRLAHHLEEVRAFSLKAVEIVVFDEADRLFEMGFAEQLHQILRSCGASRQTLLFSATLPAQLVQFSRAGLQDPHFIRLDVEQKISDQLRLVFFTLRSGEKLGALLFILHELIPREDMSIIFAPTRHHCELLHELLDAAGFESTIIYGRMDQDARHMNLEKFRKGISRILLVTDVAARGIDVPLLNNVINFSFPPTAKLFVHRVGRAARQGRSGTAFNLVETEDAPYMADLFEYLQKPPISFSEDEELYQRLKGNGYSLREMTPGMVHYGTLPQGLLDTETEYVRKLSEAKGPTLDQLHQVCERASKQYRRTRQDATSKGVSTARKLHTTELHPLCLALQTATGSDAAARASIDQSSLLSKLQSFRPPQTVFEVGTRAKAGRTLNKQAQAMQDVRIQRKRAELVNKTIMSANDAENEDTSVAADDSDGEEAFEPSVPAKVNQQSGAEDMLVAKQSDDSTQPRTEQDKKRVVLTAAEKRRLKRARRKNGKQAEQNLKEELFEAARARANEPITNESEEAAVKDKQSFKDDQYYIDYKRQGGELDEATERSLAMGAAAETQGKGMSGMIATAFEEAMRDDDPDAALKELRKKKVMHWDKRHNKFVKTTLAELGERRGKGAGKLRTESGALISRKKKDAASGALYDKWQKTTKKRIATVGEEEDGSGATGRKIDWRNKKRGRAQFRQAKAAGAVVDAGRPSKKAKSELRSPDEVAALRRKQQKLAVKNMPKAQRRALLNKQKT